MKQASLRSAMTSVLLRDLKIAFRRRADLAQPPAFMLMAATAFPLGLQPDPELMGQIAPGVIWVAALLSGMLGLNRLFRQDFDDGVLEQYFVSEQSFSALILAKIVAHWMVGTLPLLILAPILAVMLSLDPSALWTLLAALALGLPILNLVGSVAAALTVGLSRSGLLLIVITLPLIVPVIIFGAGAVTAAAQGQSPDGPLLLLGAMLVLATTAVPLVAAAGLKLSLAQQ